MEAPKLHLGNDVSQTYRFCWHRQIMDKVIDIYFATHATMLHKHV